MSIQIYVDGSWKKSKPELAGWAYIIVENDVIFYSGSGNIPCLSRQVDGELFATIMALKAINDNYYLKNKKIELFYDYVGIEAWITGKWKAKSQVAKDYIDEIKLYKEILKNVTFRKVKSHSGTSEGNDIVDKMSKDALN